MAPESKSTGGAALAYEDGEVFAELLDALNSYVKVMGIAAHRLPSAAVEATLSGPDALFCDVQPARFRGGDEPGAGGDHRRRSFVHCVDDLGVAIPRRYVEV